MSFRLFVVLSCSILVSACASSKPDDDFNLTVADGKVNMELSKDVVIGMLEDGLDTDLDCNGDVDDDIRRLLEPLARKRNARASLGEGEDRIEATRRGSHLTLTIGDQREGHLKATVPWAVGECLLGRETSIEKALGSKAIKVELVTDDGKTISARLR